MPSASLALDLTTAFRTIGAMNENDVLNLNGRVALVTGASRGIGYEVAQRLATEGVAVALGYLSSKDEAEGLAGRIRESGGRAISVGGDVSQADDLKRMVDSTRDGLGEIDILVSNAGGAKRLTLDEVTLEDWEDAINTHARAAFLLSQMVVPGMRERKWGRIILLSSLAAINGGVAGPHYSATKAAVIGLMRYMARAFAPDNITVNVVAPAFTMTDAFSRMGDERELERIKGLIPLGRFGRAAEIADLTVAAIRNGFLTGQTLLADGGIHPH